MDREGNIHKKENGEEKMLVSFIFMSETGKYWTVLYNLWRSSSPIQFSNNITTFYNWENQSLGKIFLKVPVEWLTSYLKPGMLVPKGDSILPV